MDIELSRIFEKDWERGLEIWSEYGRVEDLPRDERVPKYSPSKGKLYGLCLARKYKKDYKKLISKLERCNEFELLCAFEVLEFMCWEFDQESFPIALFGINVRLPRKIIQEIPSDSEVDAFNGSSIGEWFQAVFGT